MERLWSDRNRQRMWASGHQSDCGWEYTIRQQFTTPRWNNNFFPQLCTHSPIQLIQISFIENVFLKIWWNFIFLNKCSDWSYDCLDLNFPDIKVMKIVGGKVFFFFFLILGKKNLPTSWVCWHGNVFTQTLVVFLCVTNTEKQRKKKRKIKTGRYQAKDWQGQDVQHEYPICVHHKS